MKDKLIEYATRSGMLMDEGPADMIRPDDSDSLEKQLEASSQLTEIWTEMHDLLRKAESIVTRAGREGLVSSHVVERMRYYWASQIKAALGHESLRTSGGTETMNATIIALYPDDDGPDGGF